eukprot:scaffold61261_cov66-Phaeocystis_antarctica.AAC.2
MTPCKARSGRGRLTCTHRNHLGLQRARCGRSTRSRRSPRRAAHTLALCRDRPLHSSTDCCRWHPGSSPHLEPQTARWPAAARAAREARAARAAGRVARAAMGHRGSCSRRSPNCGR